MNLYHIYKYVIILPYNTLDIFFIVASINFYLIPEKLMQMEYLKGHTWNDFASCDNFMSIDTHGTYFKMFLICPAALGSTLGT